MAKIQLRFNNEHKSTEDAWRLIVDGVEQIVGHVTVETVMKTELFFNAQGVLKGNIYTEGEVVMMPDGKSAVIR